MLSDEALYERMIDGDLDAFDQLYSRYERPLFGFIKRYVEDAVEAEDVFHDAFMAVLRERARRPVVGSFRGPWVSG